MLNFSTKIIFLCVNKMKDITLIEFLGKKPKQTKTDIPKLTILNYNQYLKKQNKKICYHLKNILKVLCKQRKYSLL